MCLVDIAPHLIHEVRFYLSTWLLTDGRYGVVHALCTWSSLQKHRKAYSLTAAVAVISAVWEGKGIHSTHLVNWSTITRTFSLHRAVRGKGPRKPRCTLSIGAPAWYLSISALA